MKKFIAPIIALVVFLSAVGAAIWAYMTFGWKPFADNGYAGALKPVKDDDNSLAFVFDKPHNLKAGDEIEVIQDAGATRPSYNGPAKVVSVPTDKVIITNKVYAGSTPKNPGRIRRTNLTRA